MHAKPEKCNFHTTEVDYLGIIVTWTRTKVKIILDWPEPTTVKQLQSFLGFAKFYRRFIDNYSGITKRLQTRSQGQQMELGRRLPKLLPQASLHVGPNSTTLQPKTTNHSRMRVARTALYLGEAQMSGVARGGHLHRFALMFNAPPVLLSFATTPKTTKA